MPNHIVQMFESLNLEESLKKKVYGRAMQSLRALQNIEP